MSQPDLRTRSVFLAWIFSQEGKWYRWGGSGPEWDCSGLVVGGLQFIGHTLKDASAAGLYDMCRPTKTPQPGDLVFYGRRAPLAVTHVMVWTGNGTEVIGATGGDSRTTTLEIARNMDARVKRKPTHLYRRGFLGFGSLPLPPVIESPGEV